MADFTGTATLTGKSGATLSGGFVVDFTPQGIRFVRQYVGERNVPQDIKRLRRSVYEVMRRMGTPVLVKHMFTDADVKRGIAKKSANFDDVYGQTRNDDPVSHGIGFVSVEDSPNEWIIPSGTIVKSNTKPEGAIPAPKYRGFGPGYLIYMIQPDVAEDYFKLNDAGALIKIQDATAQAPFFPDINDNDLIINVEIDGAGNIVDTYERYRAKMTNPISIRGYGDMRGRRESTKEENTFGNRFPVNQVFDMALIPRTSHPAMYDVEIDR